MNFLRALDPRVLAITYPGWTTVIFIAVVLGFGLAANKQVLSLRGGILDDALPESDKYWQMNEWVEKTPGFNYSEAIPLLIRCGEDKLDCLKTAMVVTDELRDRGETVLSLATIPDYHDTGDALDDTPYISARIFEEKFDINAWKQRVSKDGSIANILVDTSLQWTMVAVLPPKDYDEVQSAWRIVEYLEGRSVPWWERLFKKDIYPIRKNVTPGGWIMGRWQIDQGLNRDMILLPLLGMLIGFPIFWYQLSLRQALLATLVSVGIGIWLTRAAIFPLHVLVDERFHERVYVILAYASIIVQGISFPLHKFKAFREAFGSSQRRFLAAFSVDGKISLAALISICGFLSLLWFNVWQMPEMGFEAIVGVGFVYVTATCFIPALYLVIERYLGKESGESLTPMTNGISGVLRNLYVSPRLAFAIPVISFFIGCVLVASSRIQTHTVPFEYIDGTSVHQTFIYQKEVGVGNESASFKIEPNNPEGSIKDLGFVKEAWRFQNDLREHLGRTQHSSKHDTLRIAAVGSILDQVAKISQESYHKPFPEEQEVVTDIFYSLEGLRDDLKEWLFVDSGIRFTVSILMNESDQLARLMEDILAFSKDYPNLKVSGFGKMQVFPQVDKYINVGFPQDVGSSFATLFFFYTSWVFIGWTAWRNVKRVTFNPLIAGFTLTLPFLFSAGVMAVLMWVLAIPLSMSTAPIFSLAINAGCDFSIYLAGAVMANFREENNSTQAIPRALESEGGIITLDCLFNSTVFLPLLLSQFGPIVQIGWMMIVMLITCVIAALVFIPSALTLAMKEVRHEPCIDDSGGGSGGGRDWQAASLF